MLSVEEKKRLEEIDKEMLKLSEAMKKIDEQEEKLKITKEGIADVVDSRITTSADGKINYYLIIKFRHTHKIIEHKASVQEYYEALETKEYKFYVRVVPKEKMEQAYVLGQQYATLSLQYIKLGKEQADLIMKDCRFY